MPLHLPKAKKKNPVQREEEMRGRNEKGASLLVLRFCARTLFVFSGMEIVVRLEEHL
jgi:hypothetical protein